MTANEAQREFWNERPGENWVRFQRDLDVMNANVLDTLLGIAAPVAGETVLDIGCGAGGSTLAIAAMVGPGGYVEGLDISQPLLTKAGARKDAQGLTNVHFRQDDAQVAAFDRRFDLIVSRFGMMFFDDPAAAFANLRRAMVPAGRIVFATWADASHNPWFSLARKIAVEHLGDLPEGDPDAPGPMAFRNTDRVLGLLDQAGFVDPVAEVADLTLDHPDGWPALRQLVPHIGPVGRFLREKDVTKDQRATLFDALDQAFGAFSHETGVSVPARINIFSALA